ncbi:amino acid ABC transporter substrate-binding protein, partial [Mesorhizobium sp. M7A.F.Ca.US.003.02.1.1]
MKTSLKLATLAASLALTLTTLPAQAGAVLD